MVHGIARGWQSEGEAIGEPYRRGVPGRIPAPRYAWDYGETGTHPDVTSICSLVSEERAHLRRALRSAQAGGRPTRPIINRGTRRLEQMSRSLLGCMDRYRQSDLRLLASCLTRLESILRVTPPGLRRLRSAIAPRLRTRTEVDHETPATPAQCDNPRVLDRFESFDYRLRRHHYKIMIDFAGNLKSLVQAARKQGQSSPGIVVRVVGRADKVGDQATEFGVALRRAMEVGTFFRQLLTGLEVSSQEIPVLVSTQGAIGPPRPGGPAANRRVDLFLCLSTGPAPGPGTQF